MTAFPTCHSFSHRRRLRRTARVAARTRRRRRRAKRHSVVTRRTNAGQNTRVDMRALTLGRHAHNALRGTCAPPHSGVVACTIHGDGVVTYDVDDEVRRAPCVVVTRIRSLDAARALGMQTRAMRTREANALVAAALVTTGRLTMMTSYARTVRVRFMCIHRNVNDRGLLIAVTRSRAQ
jgi:hypothetical protein